MEIGGRKIGPGRRTYVIAEAGVNHDGVPERALALVDAAADAGADAVKFQMFKAEELAAASAQVAAYQSAGGASQRELLARLELSDAVFDRVCRRCTERGVEFLATPFSVPDVTRLARLAVRALKTASTDLDNVPLLERAAALDVPLIVSTGAATLEEMRATVARLRSWGAGDRLILLHCVSCYPTPPEAANLRAIGALSAAFGVPVGYSDHTAEVGTGAWAVAAGACVLEKHFTLDRAAVGPDHAMSLSPRELERYIAGVREVEVALGTGALGMTKLEAEVRAVARKSVVAATDLPAGVPLEPHMLTLKRPGGGIPPGQLAELVGRRLRTHVARDAVLFWDMFE